MVVVDVQDPDFHGSGPYLPGRTTSHISPRYHQFIEVNSLSEEKTVKQNVSYE